MNGFEGALLPFIEAMHPIWDFQLRFRLAISCFGCQLSTVGRAGGVKLRLVLLGLKPHGSSSSKRTGWGMGLLL